MRAHRKAADFIEDVANREEVAAILGAPNRIDVAGILTVPNRIDVASEVIGRTLSGRLEVAPDGTVRSDFLLSAGGAVRALAAPDPVQADCRTID